jgi:hypothetical protein
MAYIPKSRLIVKQTSGEQFINSITYKDYRGTYMEMSDGKFYAGSNINNLGTELYRKEKLPKKFGKGVDFFVHRSINQKTFKFIKKIEDIPSTKNIPTSKDYKKGYFNRYFVKRVNATFGYKEINPKIFGEISSKNPKYDYNMYIPGKIKWSLKGNVIQTNQNSLLKLERFFPHITQAFPIFNEFMQAPIQENFLDKIRYYPDGKSIHFLLPQNYDLSRINDQDCGKCFFFKEGKCSYWNAAVRKNYWCKSFNNPPEEEEMKEKYKEFLNNLDKNKPFLDENSSILGITAVGSTLGPGATLGPSTNTPINPGPSSDGGVSTPSSGGSGY